MARREASHYNADYFRWQRPLGEFGGRANLQKFIKYVPQSANVVDFGCGGGYLLSHLSCRGKLGVEPNDAARAEAHRIGIECVDAVDQIGDDWADVILSNSVLEHTTCPLDELRNLRPKLKTGGLIVFSIAHETLSWPYAPADVNQHLYTWSPMALGNLFATAGFTVLNIAIIRSDWPPRISPPLLRLLGDRGFQIVCHLYWWARKVLNWLHPMKTDADLVIVARRPPD